MVVPNEPVCSGAFCSVFLDINYPLTTLCERSPALEIAPQLCLIRIFNTGRPLTMMKSLAVCIIFFSAYAAADCNQRQTCCIDDAAACNGAVAADFCDGTWCPAGTSCCQIGLQHKAGNFGCCVDGVTTCTLAGNEGRSVCATLVPPTPAPTFVPIADAGCSAAHTCSECANAYGCSWATSGNAAGCIHTNACASAGVACIHSSAQCPCYASAATGTCFGRCNNEYSLGISAHAAAGTTGSQGYPSPLGLPARGTTLPDLIFYGVKAFFLSPPLSFFFSCCCHALSQHSHTTSYTYEPGTHSSWLLLL